MSALALVRNQIKPDDRGVLRVSSKNVAEAFGKEHKNVIRDIRELDCSMEFARLNFEPNEINTFLGQETSEYFMTRDGLAFLVMGYRGSKAAEFKEAYIAAFNEMEAALRNPKIDPLNQLTTLKAIVGAIEEQATFVTGQIKLVTDRQDETRLTPDQIHQLNDAMGRRAKLLDYSGVRRFQATGSMKADIKSQFLPSGSKSVMKFTDISQADLTEALEFINTWDYGSGETIRIRRGRAAS